MWIDVIEPKRKNESKTGKVYIYIYKGKECNNYNIASEIWLDVSHKPVYG